MLRLAIKATPSKKVDGRCCILKPESNITCLTSYLGFISFEYVAINSLGGMLTHKHTNVHTKVIFQETRHLWLART